VHELALAAQVVELAAERAEGGRVRRIVLEIGRLSCALPDAVRFAFDICAEGTPVEGARLEIVETPGRARCRVCGTEMDLDRPYGVCRCGASDLDWLSGEELRIKEVEIIPCAIPAAVRATR
jgi:hydrogenase nickel incorporation protein HypA/HybF